MRTYLSGAIFGALVMFAACYSVVIIASVEARGPSCCDALVPAFLTVERRVQALEQKLASGYWYPYPPERDEAEQN